MRIYLSSRYGRRDEMRGHAQIIAGLGHTITARWLDENTHEQTEQTPEKSMVWAVEEINDVVESQCLIAFTENPDLPAPGKSRGGRHVEFGMALALGMHILIVGPRENLFMHLPEVIQIDKWDTDAVITFLENAKSILNDGYGEGVA